MDPQFWLLWAYLWPSLCCCGDWGDRGGTYRCGCHEPKTLTSFSSGSNLNLTGLTWLYHSTTQILKKTFQGIYIHRTVFHRNKFIAVPKAARKTNHCQVKNLEDILRFYPPIRTGHWGPEKEGWERGLEKVPEALSSYLSSHALDCMIVNRKAKRLLNIPAMLPL